MTVENTQNKMPPLQMGTTNEYPFTFAVLLQDPTAEEALEAIKASVLQADGTEIELVYNTDYTVTLNTDRIGGTLTVNDIRTSGDYITIYRQYAQTQEVDYKDFNSAPAETFEQCFDKLTMLSQQQQEEINRSLKLNISSTIIDPSLPEPIANNTLIWDSVGSSLKNYDIIGENNQFKADVNIALAAGQADIQAQFDEFENVINNKIEDVREAAEKINELEQAVDDAQTAANSAEASASDASQAAISATQAAQNAQTTLNTRADIDLSNLSSVGENKFNTILNNKITNCLLEVPQRIKLELNNGTLTLKAGSIVTVPNGKNTDGSLKFDYVTVASDKSMGSGASFSFVMYYNSLTGEFTRDVDGQVASVSGISEPSSPTQYQVWYDTSNNLVKRWDGTEWISNWSLPICRATASGASGITSIDQVFNGMGYIGSHWWVDKGVKGLIPNGRNEDGTLNNIERISEKLKVYSCGGGTSNWFCMTDFTGERYRNALFGNHYEQNTRPTPTANYATWYDTAENKIYFYNLGEWSEVDVAIIGTLSTTNGVIASFQPQQPFRAVDYNEAVLKSSLVEIPKPMGFPDYTKGISKSNDTQYTADTDGQLIVLVGFGWTLNFTYNGTTISFPPNNSQQGWKCSFTFFIKKGATYKVSISSGFGSANFYPMS